MKIELGQTWECADADAPGEWFPVAPYTHPSLGCNWTVRNSDGRVLYMSEHHRVGLWTLKYPAPAKVSP